MKRSSSLNQWLHSEHTGNDDAFSGGQEKDGLSLLNEILGSSSLEDRGFSQEWREVFGEDDPADGSRAETQLPEEEPAFFLPSKLLDQNMNDPQSSVSGLQKHLIRKCA